MAEALDAEATRQGYVGDKPLTSCGPECWRESYDEGLTPAEAIKEDESYG